jgi:hypothetical protein
LWYDFCTWSVLRQFYVFKNINYWFRSYITRDFLHITYQDTKKTVVYNTSVLLSSKSQLNNMLNLFNFFFVFCFCESALSAVTQIFMAASISIQRQVQLRWCGLLTLLHVYSLMFLIQFFIYLECLLRTSPDFWCFKISAFYGSIY